MIKNYDEKAKQLHFDIERYIELNKEYQEFKKRVCNVIGCDNCDWKNDYSCYADDLIDLMNS